MTREEADFIGGMNMCDEISNEAYKKIMCHCEEQEHCEDAISRQAVLSKIKEVCFSKDWVQFRVATGSNGQRDYLINYIKQLPPVCFSRNEHQDRPATELLHRVIDRKGKDHQIDIAIEEMSELTKALLKDRRHHSSETVTDITEEMADVYICLAELSIIFENRSEVEDMIDRKLQRLKKRLKEDEEGKENGNGSDYTVTAPQGGQAR